MAFRRSDDDTRQARRSERLSYERDARPSRDGRPMRVVIITLVLIAALLVVALVGFIVLSSTPAFTITSIDAEDTEHLTAENIAKLANVEEGTTLLNIDEGAITENLKRNPWVGSVTFVREFPDRLKIVIEERVVDCVVKMSTGSVCWCLGNDSIWIEPINLTVKDGQSADDVALALARDMGSLLITDVPTSMSPSAGETASDEVLVAVAAYREQFSEEFGAQIIKFSAASVESIACTLENGVEISLGAPTDIDIKEAVITELLAKHPNQITYINVRVPSQPSYRKLGVESVTGGSGVTVDELTDETGATATQQPTDGQADAAAGQTPSGDGQTTDNAQQEGGTGQMADGSQVGDTSDLILGEDGYYYTYEQYYGLD